MHGCETSSRPCSPTDTRTTSITSAGCGQPTLTRRRHWPTPRQSPLSEERPPLRRLADVPLPLRSHTMGAPIRLRLCHGTSRRRPRGEESTAIERRSETASNSWRPFLLRNRLMRIDTKLSRLSTRMDQVLTDLLFRPCRSALRDPLSDPIRLLICRPALSARAPPAAARAPDPSPLRSSRPLPVADLNTRPRSRRTTCASPTWSCLRETIPRRPSPARRWTAKASRTSKESVDGVPENSR